MDDSSYDSGRNQEINLSYYAPLEAQLAGIHHQRSRAQPKGSSPRADGGVKKPCSHSQQRTPYSLALSGKRHPLESALDLAASCAIVMP